MARIKIVDYKGKVVGRWTVPKTKKQFTWCIIKLVRFYYRCKKNNLLTNEIISVLKSFVESEAIKTSP